MSKTVFKITITTLTFLAGVALLSAGYAGWRLLESGGAGAGTRAAADPLVPDPNLEALAIPEFSLTDQSGETRTRDLFVGEVTILDFFFTNCPFVCPPMQRNMKRLQERLDGSGVQFVSIAVDPRRDTPQALRAFAEEIDADLSTWTFLTGPRDEVQRIVTDGLLLAPLRADERTPISLEDGGTMSNIVHPSHFILVGPDGDVLGLYNGLNAAEVSAIGERASAAAAALQRG